MALYFNTHLSIPFYLGALFLVSLVLCFQFDSLKRFVIGLFAGYVVLTVLLVLGISIFSCNTNQSLLRCLTSPPQMWLGVLTLPFTLLAFVGVGGYLARQGYRKFTN